MQPKGQHFPVSIGYGVSKNLDIQIRRGAWTEKHAPEYRVKQSGYWHLLL